MCVDALFSAPLALRKKVIGAKLMVGVASYDDHRRSPFSKVTRFFF